jgi:hypothetical protein
MEQVGPEMPLFSEEAQQGYMRQVLETQRRFFKFALENEELKQKLSRLLGSDDWIDKVRDHVGEELD